MVELSSILKYGSSGILGILGLSKIVEKSMKNYDSDVQPPVDTVSIIMPAYNEEEFIERASSSIRYQSLLITYPEYFEFIVVDNGSTDNTVELAKAFADKVVKSSRGKLSARNFGTKISKNNIIVAVDSDIFYPYNWLNTLLKTFRDPEIAGVSGTILDYKSGVHPIIFMIMTSMGRISQPYQMFGGNCAYYKDIFNNIGQFNENINQFDIKEMVKEEEFDFGKRLSYFGKVTYKFNASCIHLGGTRTGCRNGFKDRFSDTCKAYQFGKDRF